VLVLSPCFTFVVVFVVFTIVITSGLLLPLVLLLLFSSTLVNELVVAL